MTLSSGVKPSLHRSQAVVKPARCYEPPLRQSLTIHHHDEPFRLVGADSLVGDEQGGCRAAPLELHTHEQTRGEQAVRIVDEGACAQSAGLWVEAVVHKVHLPCVREFFLVRERDPCRIRSFAATIFAAQKDRGGCSLSTKRSSASKVA